MMFQHLDRLARNMWPFVFSMLLVMASSLPIQAPHFGKISPNLALMAVFYWAIYRPDLFPMIAAFALGLWQDVLVGSPIGTHAVTLLLVHWAVTAQRTFFQGKSFTVVWWAFALIATGASLVLWLLAMAWHTVFVGPLPLVFQFFLTVALYPFVTWLFARAQHAVLRQV